jgi:regulatory protein YycH of two-component signal transduction system YycFG
MDYEAMKIEITKAGIDQQIEAAELLRQFLKSDSEHLHLYEAGFDFVNQFLGWLGQTYSINARINSEQLTNVFYTVLREKKHTTHE